MKEFQQEASFSRRVSGLSVLYTNPPAFSRWLFSGANPVIAHPVFWQRVKNNRRQPAIVVLDPRQTETAREASLHLALQPNSDLAVLYGLANWLIANGHVKNDWVAAHTHGFESFAAHVRDYTFTVL